jgi:ElaB/YqjD/DUF883 family membrane-anchored ribosome-binding protein
MLPELSPDPEPELDQIRADLAEMRTQLTGFADRVGRAFETLAERDRQIVGGMNARVREHGELIARETARIVEATVSYVQEGLAAIGQLSGTIQARVETISTGAEIEARVREAIDEQAGYLLEHLQLMHDRIGLEARDEVARSEATEAHLHEALMGLSKLTRSDAEAVRDRIASTANALGDRIATTENELREGITRITAEQNLWFASALDAQEERSMQVLSAIGSVLEELPSKITFSEEIVGDLRAIIDEAVDEKIRALARMVRSDNERLGMQLVAEQEASKQVLRAMKELQAGVTEAVEQRLDLMAEGIQTSHEKLSSRVDRMARKVGERYDDNLKVVIDRMGDAMHALASLGHGENPGEAQDRLELD